MPNLMCAPELREALKGAGEPCVHPYIGRVPRPLLGNWAATLVRAGHTALIVALNERAYLTLVFPLKPVAVFRRSFMEALTFALQDHGASPARIPAECDQIEAAPVVPLRDQALQAAVHTAAFIAETEIRCCDSLREVQWNVNQFPHENVEPLVPTQRTRLLFAAPDQAVPSFSRRVWQPGRRDCIDALLRTRDASRRIAASFARLAADLAGSVPERVRSAAHQRFREIPQFNSASSSTLNRTGGQVDDAPEIA